MKSWFYNLEPREQVLVTTATVFVAFAIVWFGVWAPLDRNHADTELRVESWQRSLAELRPMRGPLQMANSGRPASQGQNQSLVVIIDNSLRQRTLTPYLQRSQPTPSGTGIRVEFEAAPFDDLMLWLGDLHRQYGLELESGSFSTSSSDTPGRVNSSVTLQR